MVNLKTVLQKTYLSAHDRKVKLNCDSKLKRICRDVSISAVDNETQRKYKSVWSEFDSKPSLLFLNCVTSISGICSPEFVPEYIYYTKIEPALNNRLFAMAYNDKNFFERYLHEFKDMFPKAYLRGIAGEFYDGEFLRLDLMKTKKKLIEMVSERDYVLKPATETGAGDNVTVVRIQDNGVIVGSDHMNIDHFLDILKKKYKMNFVLQERIKQSNWFSLFNNEATNIIRMFTYRSVTNNEIYTLHSYIRYGAINDSFQEYLSNGGYRRGISSSGILAEYSIGRYGEPIYDDDVLKLSDKEAVPHYTEMVSVSRKIGAMFYHHRLLGFDFIIDAEDKVRVLEVNLRNIGMVHHQLIGGPLFGQYTQEVLSYCKSHMKSASYHFYYD